MWTDLPSPGQNSLLDFMIDSLRVSGSAQQRSGTCVLGRGRGATAGAAPHGAAPRRRVAPSGRVVSAGGTAR